MHGDFSLNPLAHRDNVSRVLFQQGRVQLDSDANELTESLLRWTRALAADTIGEHGGVENSFEITFDGTAGEFSITYGQYYVDGLRCVNLPNKDLWDSLAADPSKFPYAGGVLLIQQPHAFPLPRNPQVERAAGLFYLDAFEHHLTYAQDDSLRESALLGPDTTTRALVLWQVRKLSEADTRALEELVAKLPTLPRVYDKAYVGLNLFLRPGARLRARAILKETTDPCAISPDARYRGTENRLFRVEVHTPGGVKPDGTLDGNPTFKFSRDNGAEVYPIRDLQGKTVILDSLGRDQRTAIRVNDWVEVVDDEVLLMRKALKLRQVVNVSRADMTVTLDDVPEENVGTKQDRHPLLRRWAGPPRAIELRDAADPKLHWLDLADGVQVQFSFARGYRTGFRTGDYWVIPARTATGDVVWPQAGKDDPLALAPHGVDHRYAPLDRWGGSAFSGTLRKTFLPLTLVQPRP